MSPEPPAEFFSGSPVGWEVHQAVERVVSGIGGHEVRVSRSQVAFRRDRGFAFLWRPGQYVHSDVPVVLSIALRRRLDSPRFKQIAHPSRTTWMHHLELRSVTEVDDEVARWLLEAYTDAGGASP